MQFAGRIVSSYARVSTAAYLNMTSEALGDRIVRSNVIRQEDMCDPLTREHRRRSCTLHLSRVPLQTRMLLSVQARCVKAGLLVVQLKIQSYHVSGADRFNRLSKIKTWHSKHMQCIVLCHAKLQRSTLVRVLM